MKVINALFMLTSLLAMATQAQESQTFVVGYKSFTVWLDCSSRSATLWSYTIGIDTGNYERHKEFYLDPNIPNHCQQKSTSTYKTPKGAVKYDRGHLVPANAMDSDPLDIAQSNIMTNVLPQVAQMNRGAMYQTELFVECRRDHHVMTIYGGVYQGTMPADGDFTESHGVIAPEAFWKVVMWNQQAIAWWIPNSEEATASMIDSYIVAPADIEVKANVTLPIAEELKPLRQGKTNAKTPDCDPS